MSDPVSVAAFRDKLASAIARFKTEEALIRGDHAAAARAGIAPFAADELLERPTRRFLIDPMLRALDWNPDDPQSLVEEAKSWAETGERLYFDYLGVSCRGLPTLLVEAKGADAVKARSPRERDLSASEMSERISQALGKLKNGEKPGILATWVEWLQDLRAYVASLGVAGRLCLKRVVITSGRWLVIFRDPLAAFVDLGEPEPSEIRCYVSFDEMFERHGEIYELLARRRLIDTLPRTMRLDEALPFISPSSVTGAFRGVVVSTRMAGPVRSEFPIRAVYPAVVLLSGGREFAVVDYRMTSPAIEPLQASQLEGFIADLSTRAEMFQKQVLHALQRPDQAITPATQFPLELKTPQMRSTYVPEPGSTDSLLPAPPAKPQLRRVTGERDERHEFLLITGSDWFYKAASSPRAACTFHSFPRAKQLGVAGEQGRFDHVADSFTISGDPQNCEHVDLLARRRSRCQMLQVESHLCCWACSFRPVCWSDAELSQLPCEP